MSAHSITFGSFCSGIEAASEAFLPLGWACAYVSEIEPFPCSYLHQRHGAARPRYMPRPEDAADAKDRARRTTMLRANGKLPEHGRLTNFGDLAQVRAAELPRVDVIAAGFPCQDFSIAGLRASLSGGRGSLSIIGVRLILEAADLGLVRAALLEQVPDVLNTEDNAWGNILGALVGADAPLQGLEHGGKWPRAGMVAGPRARIAWRILDAQHFGLAQRRERVWAVVDFGDGPDPAAVLFEPKGMPGHPAESHQAREDVAPTLSARTRGGGGLGTDFDCDGGLVLDGTQRGAETVCHRVAGTLGQRSADHPSGLKSESDFLVAAFGGNNTSGPIDVATARTASHTASGRQDFESETFIVDGHGSMARSDIAPPLRASGADAGHGSEAMVAHSLRGEGFDASEDGTGRGTPLVPVERPIAFDARQSDVLVYGDITGPLDTGFPGPAIAFSCKDYGADAGPLSPTMRAMGHADSHANAGGQVAVAFSLRGREGGAMPEVEGGDVSPALRAAEGGSTRPFIAFDETQITSAANRSNPKAGDPCHPLAAQARPPTLANDMAVRRITVVEACRLQGFPDFATLIDWPSGNRKGADLEETIAYLVSHGFSPERAAELAQTPDGPQYKALGNSWPVPVAAWIGERMDAEFRRIAAHEAAA